MMNPMLQALGATSPTAGLPANIKNIKNTITMLKNAKNPAALMQSLIQQNPEYKRAADYIQSCGGDPKKAFEQLAREKGIDPAEIAAQLQGI